MALKVTKKTAHNVTLKDSPGCFWLFGLFFVVIGIVVIAGFSGLFFNPRQGAQWERIVAIIIALCVITAGLYVINKNHGTIVEIDKKNKILDIRRYGISKRESQTYSIEEIDQVFLEESEDTDGDPVYRPALKMTDGKTVRLSYLWMHSREDEMKTVEKVREIIKTELFD